MTFINRDGALHSATSTQAGLFDTGALQAGQSAVVTVDFRGDAAYFCKFHPRMTGSLSSS